MRTGRESNPFPSGLKAHRWPSLADYAPGPQKMENPPGLVTGNLLVKGQALYY